MWVRPGANPRVEHLKDALLRKAPALLANIRLDWKGLPRTKYSGLLRTIINYDRKMFYCIGSRDQDYKKVTVVI